MIEIDFDVFKELTARRASESVTHNDVLREIFGLPPKSQKAEGKKSGGWTWKGVHLENGTELKAVLKGRAYFAKIEGDEWVQDGAVFKSPSAAAMKITGHGINGWWFWSAKRANDAEWVPLAKLRK